MIDPIALEDAVYWLMCERSAQMGESYTHEMHEAAKAEDQDYISDIRFQVKSAIKAYESAKTKTTKPFWVVFFKDSNGRMTQTMFEHNPTADFKNMYNYYGTKLIEIDMSDL